MTKPLYDPANGLMMVVGLMSGSGTNLRKIIEYERVAGKLDHKLPYHVAVIFSDNSESNAVSIGKDYNLPVVIRDKKMFYAAEGKPLKDLKVRAEFDAENVKILNSFGATVAAYAGYMSIATKPLIDAFLGINVHPADLSVLNAEGKRKYTGDHAVMDAIIAGEKYIRSTTHIIEEKVDGGRILMISEPVAVEQTNPDAQNMKEFADKHQNELKEKGDWMIFPKTLEYIAKGRYSKDFNGNLYFDGKPIPYGLKL